ncbi:Minor fimbrium tip subunit Mfa3 [bioreactor metagenome]|uniref:Minor fimbrium tip subunit Mfa3 n=1 Tax=bioreactor metagenome TaxID=1076179 RepID=A0A645DMQ2_9ZZZZ
MIFDSDTGEKISEYFSTNVGSGNPATRVFTVELTPGKRDFYFVANMPQEDLQGTKIPDRNAMDTYLGDASRILNDGLYPGASATGGFPMARVYLNQEVKEGGTIYQPKPFKPKQYNTEKGKVVVNTAGSGTDEREYVELIRVVAKLEVTLDGATDLGVDKVYFRNANRRFRLVEFATVPAAYYNDNSTQIKELKQVGTTNTYLYYMPEAYIASATWSSTGNNQPINYFTIKTVDGTEYDIPIISNETSITEDYLAKAKGAVSGFTPNYTVYRNHRYKYVVKNLEKIEIVYEVEPWNMVNKILYMGYGYNVEVDGKKVIVSNTVNACDPHHVKLKTVGAITFSDGTTEKDFTDVAPTASMSYELSSEPSEGYGNYLEVYYNDNLVKTFTK